MLKTKIPINCCDNGQNDTISKIELPNCQNNIQLFLQQFEKSGVNGDTN